MLWRSFHEFLIVSLTTFHYNPYLRFIKFEMVFKCWMEYRRSRWILMATSGMRNWTQQKSGYISLVHSCQSVRRATRHLATCHVQVDIMRRAGSSQWNRFSCITQDESDVTLWWHIQMLYFHLLHSSFNGGIALQKVGDCFARPSTHLRAAFCLL